MDNPYLLTGLSIIVSIACLSLLCWSDSKRQRTLKSGSNRKKAITLPALSRRVLWFICYLPAAIFISQENWTGFLLWLFTLHAAGWLQAELFSYFSQVWLASRKPNNEH